MKSIVVVGSSNTDMVIQADHFPAPGETLLGGSFFMNPGGKGANQAVAAARLGGDVTFICRVGNDVFGKKALQQFSNEGINTEYVKEDTEHPSGVALITIDASGENSIVVASGANEKLGIQDAQDAEAAITSANYILMQLEIPMQAIEFVAKKGYELNKKVVLNPAPAAQLSDELLSNLYLITPNETEAETLTGIKVKDAASATEAAKFLRGKGVQNVIITMGKLGAFILSDGIEQIVPSPEVQAKDTTAAGDTFNGALLVALAEGKGLKEATSFACEAAAISVTRMGAQSSIPHRTELTI